MTTKPSDDAAGGGDTPKSPRPRAQAPQYGNVQDLMALVQTQRTETGDDTARQFTNGGFKTAGGIDSLPPSTRGIMIGSLALSLAIDAGGDGSAATEAQDVLKTVTEFAGTAGQQASNAKRLKAFEDIAALDNLSPRAADESVDKFMKRISVHVAKQNG